MTKHTTCFFAIRVINNCLKMERITCLRNTSELFSGKVKVPLLVSESEHHYHKNITLH